MNSATFLAHIVIKGATQCGFSQISGERTGNYKDKHVDWWIFRNSSEKLVGEFEKVAPDEEVE